LIKIAFLCYLVLGSFFIFFNLNYKRTSCPLAKGGEHEKYVKKNNWFYKK
jgi:hypothetical protein